MANLFIMSTSMASNKQSVFNWATIGLVSFGFVVALLIGLLTSTGNKYLILGGAAILGILFVLITPALWTLWLMLIASFVVVGPVSYFSGMTQLMWLPALMGAAVFLQVMIHAIRGQEVSQGRAVHAWFLYYLICWLMVAIFGTIIDKPALSELINSSRYYFFMWPVLLALMNGMVHPGVMERFWKMLLLFSMLQPPMVLYQYFVVAKKSTRLSPWDAVVGTFPGDIDGGGQSAAMAIFLLVAMLLAIALWRSRHIHGMWATLIVVGGLGSLSLAEVKAAVLLLPVIVVIYFWKEIGKRPLQSLGFMAGAGGVMVLLFSGYQYFHYSQSTASGRYSQYSAIERVLVAIDPDEVSGKYQQKTTGTGLQLGRVTQLVFWWEEHARKVDIQHAIFGYGMGATQVTKLGSGELAKRYLFPTDTTSSSILLWETGFLGHVFFVALLVSALLSARRSALHPAVPEIHKILLRVGALGLFLLLVTLPYKNMALRSIPIQFMMMLMLGHVAYWWRMSHQYDLGSMEP